MKKNIIFDKDLNKRPSDLEIKEKNLPPNTPTLEHRLKRDAVHKFYSPDKKGGYLVPGKTGKWHDWIDEDLTLKDLYHDGSRELKNQVRLFKEEVKHYHSDEHWKKVFVMPGDKHYICNFAENLTTSKIIDDLFVVSSDASWGEGYSYGSVEASQSLKSAIFCGDLSTSVPQDGRLQRSGYVNIKTVTQRLCLGRIKHLDFDYYNAVILRIRGDGRTYTFNIHLTQDIDMHFLDLHSFPLHTRGGPYWQDVVIPYNKFFLGHRGFIQDEQFGFDKERVENVSITIMDGINGPFCLEIAHIGLTMLEGPMLLQQGSFYETYRVPHGLYLGSTW